MRIVLFWLKIKTILNNGKEIKLILEGINFNISSFVLLDKDIYILDKYKKWYYYYNTKDNIIGHMNINEYIYNIWLQWDNIVFIKNENKFKQLQINPEFEIKYKNKLIKIKSNINNKPSFKQRKKLKNLFINNKNWFYSKIKSEYRRIELEYLIDEIIKLL